MQKTTQKTRIMSEATENSLPERETAFHTKKEEFLRKNAPFFHSSLPSFGLRAIRELGRGTFGVVVAAAICPPNMRHKDDITRNEEHEEELVAIKRVPFLASSPQSKATTFREFQVLFHPVQKFVLYYQLTPISSTMYENRNCSSASATVWKEGEGEAWKVDREENDTRMRFSTLAGPPLFFSPISRKKGTRRSDGIMNEEKGAPRKVHCWKSTLESTPSFTMDCCEQKSLPNSFIFFAKPLFRPSLFEESKEGVESSPSRDDTTQTKGLASRMSSSSPLACAPLRSALPPSWAQIGLQYGPHESTWWRHITGHPNIIRLYGYYDSTARDTTRASSGEVERTMEQTAPLGGGAGVAADSSVRILHKGRGREARKRRGEKATRHSRAPSSCETSMAISAFFSSPTFPAEERDVSATSSTAPLLPPACHLPHTLPATACSEPCEDHTSSPPSPMASPTLYLMMEMMPINLAQYVLQREWPHCQPTSHKKTPSAGTPSLHRSRAASLPTCDSSSFPLFFVKLIIFQIARALSFLHSYSICHRDLKPQNILLNDETGEVKLCDFGSAACLPPPSSSLGTSTTGSQAAVPRHAAYVCSRFYRAPELMLGSTVYGPPIDIWSLGCILAELLHLHLATHPSTADACRRRKRRGQAFFQGPTTAGQLVEIMKVLGTPSREDLIEISPGYLAAMEHVLGVRKRSLYGLPCSTHYLYTAAEEAAGEPSNSHAHPSLATCGLSTAASSSLHDHHPLFSMSSSAECRPLSTGVPKEERPIEGGEPTKPNYASNEVSSPSLSFPSHFCILPKTWPEVLLKRPHWPSKTTLTHREQQGWRKKSDGATEACRGRSGKVERGLLPPSSPCSHKDATPIRHHSPSTCGEEVAPALPQGAEDLLRRTLCFLPRQRLAAAEVVQHPFFEDLFSHPPARDDHVCEVKEKRPMYDDATRGEARTEEAKTENGGPVMSSSVSTSGSGQPAVCTSMGATTSRSTGTPLCHRPRGTSGEEEKDPLFSSDSVLSYPSVHSHEELLEWPIKGLPLSLFMLSREEIRLYSPAFRVKMLKAFENIRQHLL